MSLQLNDPPVYQEFIGAYNEQMPLLISEGRTPMTVADLMRRRLEVANSTPDVRASWITNYFCTSDAVLYRPSGKIKIVLDAEPLRAITPANELRDGALAIDEEMYRRLPGAEFPRKDINVGNPLTIQQVMGNPIWQMLARNDRVLLREYALLVFSESRRCFDDDGNMGVYLSDTPDTPPTLRAWRGTSIITGSNLGGHYDLNYAPCRLVGVARATQVRVSARM